jgi:hypothetical protein
MCFPIRMPQDGSYSSLPQIYMHSFHGRFRKLKLREIWSFLRFYVPRSRALLVHATGVPARTTLIYSLTSRLTPISAALSKLHHDVVMKRSSAFTVERPTYRVHPVFAHCSHSRYLSTRQNLPCPCGLFSKRITTDHYMQEPRAALGLEDIERS